jgi:hypothetical protein
LQLNDKCFVLIAARGGCLFCPVLSCPVLSCENTVDPDMQGVKRN